MAPALSELGSDPATRRAEAHAAALRAAYVAAHPAPPPGRARGRPAAAVAARAGPGARTPPIAGAAMFLPAPWGGAFGGGGGGGGGGVNGAGYGAAHGRLTEAPVFFGLGPLLPAPAPAPVDRAAVRDAL